MRDVFYETPDVRFKGKYLFIAPTDNTTHPIACSSYPIYMKYMKSYLGCSYMKIRETDKNNDNKIDEISLELKVNLPKSSKMHSFTLIIPVELKLHSPQCPLEMQTGIILQKEIHKKSSSLLVVANMDVKQNSPLYCSHKRINTDFNHSLITDEGDLKQFKLNNILEQHYEKNLTTTISNIYTIGEEKNKDIFLLKIKIRYTEQKFIYKSRFTQIIKWAWIQYYSIYIVIYYVTNHIKNYIFDNRLVLYYEQNPLKMNK
ncbi:hypothetical protein WA026_022354 [Henosepilachna vigintioctopunctata]|uniref:Transmembrane protein 231 n=1 Tax=Henosepilachna vigintioctopunctata TaxID=420089 RepID=A0AAW1V3P5_9CUCU